MKEGTGTFCPNITTPSSLLSRPINTSSPITSSTSTDRLRSRRAVLRSIYLDYLLFVSCSRFRYPSAIPQNIHRKTASNLRECSLGFLPKTRNMNFLNMNTSDLVAVQGFHSLYFQGLNPTASPATNKVTCACFTPALSNISCSIIEYFICLRRTQTDRKTDHLRSAGVAARSIPLDAY